MKSSRSHNFIRTHRRTIAIAAAATFGTLLLGVGLLVAFTRPTDDRTIVRGVSIAGIAAGGMTDTEAKEAVRTKIEGLRLAFRAEDKAFSLDPDADPAFASFDVDGAVAQALAVGREGGPFVATADRIRALGWGGDIALPVTLDRVALRAEVERETADLSTLAKNASFAVSLAGAEPRITVIPESEGKVIDFDALMTAADERLRALSPDTIVLRLRTDDPDVRMADAEALIEEAARAIRRAPLTLDAGKERWTLSRATVADQVAPVFENGSVRLGLDKDKAHAFLSARATSVTVEPKNAEFEEKDGKVTHFVPGTEGETLDIEDAIARIQDLLGSEEDPASKTVELTIVPKPPEIPTEASNPYGIKEIIGVGASNFRGSPKNRRHNIAVGAKAVDGTIVPPGEEFSMLKTLGTIDGSTGYLQELVIKGDRTIPEYGGGLCQIGSTAFRGALASGMPITARQNHSYRVSYYERAGDGSYIGPGKDATIYDPAPDFRFKNDTAHAIMIRTEIQKDTLSFIFWGVDDGRVASQTDARVYNVVQPPPKKLIETDDLPPGQEKCTESPHPGSDAVFTYSVAYPNGETKVVDFKSHYRPWQEVCLIGRDPNKPLDPEGAVVDPTTISADASGAAGANETN